MNVLSFPDKPSICPVLSMKENLDRTAALCTADANKMFIQLRKPHKSMSLTDPSSLDDKHYGRCRHGHQYVLPAQYSQCLGCMVRYRNQDNFSGLDLQTCSVVQSHHHIQIILSQSTLHTGRG